MNRKLCSLMLLAVMLSLARFSLAHSVSMTCTDSDATVVSFNFYRSQVTGGPYSQINPAPVMPCAFSDTLVTDGQTYYYVVRAKNATGVESGNSNEGKAVIPQALPQAPTLNLTVK